MSAACMRCGPRSRAHATDLGRADHRLAEGRPGLDRVGHQRHPPRRHRPLRRGTPAPPCTARSATPDPACATRTAPVPLRAAGGRGLWLVRQLCDHLHITIADTDTTITAILDDTGPGR
jgi:hypothetical protein